MIEIKVCDQSQCGGSKQDCLRSITPLVKTLGKIALERQRCQVLLANYEAVHRLELRSIDGESDNFACSLSTLLPMQWHRRISSVTSL
jgi:hypothetical protein